MDQCAQPLMVDDPFCALAAMEQVMERPLTGERCAVDDERCHAADTDSAVEEQATSGSETRGDCTEATTITTLPSELVAVIAAHLTIDDRVRLAATCKALRVAVYNAPQLWRQIEFSPLSGPRVTDAMLSTLLTQCSARIRTTQLSLVNCTKIMGSGLVPLSGSLVLREIDLRTSHDHMHTHGPSGLNDVLVGDILRPSLESPSATKVKQRPQQCRENQLCSMCTAVSCDYCETSGQCSVCEEDFCSDCCTECEQCKKVFCDDCQDVTFCEGCNKSFCNNCRVCGFCEPCNKMFCDGCRVSGFCRICRKGFCFDCRMTGWCEKCGGEFCHECRG